ncbi:IGLL5 isoform 3 [Pan troglodytes]|uniref:IGLL5 isoform 3 n=1 Tax=Pan troglodytes TaxID=9598 RepID=A0A2J8IY48_PANTR|nr:IGLL5 isoform 3 [Pan troglodytes]
MRPKTGQVGCETPEELGPGPRQRWPLLLLGLAMVAHGLLRPMVAPQSGDPDPGASVGSSRSSLRSLWGRSAQGQPHSHPVPALL